MSYTLKSIKDLPDVSFIDNDTLEAMQARMVKNFEDEYFRQTGHKITLAPADPNRLIINAHALELYQVEQYVDRAGKQDLIKYSYGEYLENLGASRGVTRNQAAPAECIVRFTLSTTRPNAIPIPQYTRVTNGVAYFRTENYAEIPAGQLSVDVRVICTENGKHNNDILPGQINGMVDLIPYVESVENITATKQGADLETDENLAERVYLIPGSYSVAGPDDAYRYWAKTYNQNIGDVKIVSPKPVEVEIYFLLQDGSLPEGTIITGLEQYLQDNNIRPLTDKVRVLAPQVVNFDINLTYYINYSDQNKAVSIQNRVQQAINDYIVWQTHYIGRDINPSELTKRIIDAGAKRVHIDSPEFKVIPSATVARVGTQTISYGGIEID